MAGRAAFELRRTEGFPFSHEQNHFCFPARNPGKSGGFLPGPGQSPLLFELVVQASQEVWRPVTRLRDEAHGLEGTCRTPESGDRRRQASSPARSRRNRSSSPLRWRVCSATHKKQLGVERRQPPSSNRDRTCNDASLAMRKARSIVFSATGSVTSLQLKIRTALYKQVLAIVQELQNRFALRRIK